ncbi:hypothetical protein J6590_035233 [Homalodisca vitripennis]|nr:hypothetical protein J6590_035233 [Homalodisca vitripennis]
MSAQNRESDFRLVSEIGRRKSYLLNYVRFRPQGARFSFNLMKISITGRSTTQEAFSLCQDLAVEENF